jgi:phosphoserine phosphatase RsbU/P
VTPEDELLEDSAEELFEDAPCGYLSTRLDGTIVKVNRTFEHWTGLARADLLGGRRFQDLLTAGGRIYHETHYAPLLQMQGSVREIAVEIVRADGSRLPALVNSVVRHDPDGRPRVVRTTVFDATDRRRYEQELLGARRREHEIAQELQRSLLSGELPQAPDLDLGVGYHPAVRGLDVGGDWYDAFWLDGEEAIGLVVGDVVGRGIGAAAVMGQLRSAVRALASTGAGPAGVLTALDRYAARHAVGRMATLVYAELDPASGRLRYACAGHPPPLLLPPGGGAAYAWEGRSLPLDAWPTGPRGEAEVRLAPGTGVLLYTDGLIERRSGTLDAGLARLLAEAEAHAAEPAQAAVRAVARSLAGDERPDDVCLLLARRGAPG